MTSWSTHCSNRHLINWYENTITHDNICGLCTFYDMSIGYVVITYMYIQGWKLPGARGYTIPARAPRFSELRARKAPWFSWKLYTAYIERSPQILLRPHQLVALGPSGPQENLDMFQPCIYLCTLSLCQCTESATCLKRIFFFFFKRLNNRL